MNGAPTLTAHDEAHGAVPALVFPTRVRWLLAGGTAVVGTTIIVLFADAPAGRDPYLLAHALGAAPFLLVGVGLTAHVNRVCPDVHRPFWRYWFAAGITGILATASGIAAVAFDMPIFLALDMVMLAAGVPLWVTAVVHMARAQAGTWSLSVDLVDAATALLVLGAPGVLLLAGPVMRADNPALALPFVLSAIVVPAVVYLSILNLRRIPRGERSAHVLGMGLATTFVANLTLQIAHTVGELALPLAGVLAVHVANMAFLMLVPLWARRRMSPPLPARTPAGRFSPMPYISAVALPVLAILVYTSRDDRPWGEPFLIAILLLLVALNTIRHTASTRETRRLHAGLAQMAEERRRLLAGMLRGLEDDHWRTATELHSQAVGSLAALASVTQAAQLTLPADIATTIRETIVQLQADLRDRAEELRQLMVAIRPGQADLHCAGQPGEHPAENVLAVAVRAHAAELYGDAPAPALRVAVDPALDLDWATTTIAYRIIQEALSNTARHAGASTITVRVSPDEGRAVVEVADDGAGYLPARITPGTGLVTMQLFAQLGQGELDVRSEPGEGTIVRAHLGGSTSRTPPPDGHPGGSPHLWLVPPPRAEPQPAGGSRHD